MEIDYTKLLYLSELANIEEKCRKSDYNLSTSEDEKNNDANAKSILTYLLAQGHDFYHK